MNEIAIHQVRICEALRSVKVGMSFTSWPNGRYLKTTECRWFRFNFITPIMLGIASGTFRNTAQPNFFTNFLLQRPNYKTSP